MTVLAAGFLLGLAGSAHCLGMCGPLVLYSGAAGRVDDSPRGWQRSSHWQRFVLHHAGRLATYVALGAAAGLTGGAIADAGWRNWLAIAAGVVLIAQAVGLAGRIVGTRPGRWLTALTSRVARSMPLNPLARSATLGILNGLMPCGLLYAALAAAAGLGRLSAAVGFMIAFGVGSLPAFSALAFSARAFIPKLPRRLGQAAPIAIALLGLMLIARGWPSREDTAPQPHSFILHSALTHPR